MKKRIILRIILLFAPVLFLPVSVFGSYYLDSLRKAVQEHNPHALEDISLVFASEEKPDSVFKYADFFIESGKLRLRIKGASVRSRAHLINDHYEKAREELETAKRFSGFTQHSIEAADIADAFARIHYHAGNFVSFELFNEKAFRISDSLDYVPGEVRAKLNRARYKLYSGKAHRARIEAEEALELSRLSDKRLRLYTQKLIADCKVGLELYKPAHEEYQFLLKKYSEKQQLYQKAEVLIAVSDMHNRNNKLKEAESYLLNAKGIYEAAGMPVSANRLLVSTGDLWKVANPGKSVYYFKEAIKKYDRSGDRIKKGEANLKLGLAYRDLTAYEDAGKAFEQAIDLFESGQVQSKLSRALMAAAKLYREQEETQKEAEYLNRAYEQIKTYGDLEERTAVMDQLSKARARQGQYQKAYALQREIHALEDSLHAQSLKQKTRPLQSELEATIEQSNINKANARREIQQLERENDKLRSSGLRNQLIFIISFVIITGLILYGAFKRIKLKRKLRKLQVEYRETRIELDEFIAVHDHRAQKTASRLRDGIAQTVRGVQSSFQRFFSELHFETTMQQARFKQSLEYLEETGDELQSLSENISSKTLTDEGLVKALSGEIDKTFKNTAITGKFDYFGISADDRLNIKMEMNVFFIAKELLANVSKHAGADKAYVKLLVEDNLLRLYIEDDGKGFKPEGQEISASAKGLLLVRSRAKYLNADLGFKLRPGKGTIVSLSVPLNRFEGES